MSRAIRTLHMGYNYPKFFFCPRLPFREAFVFGFSPTVLEFSRSSVRLAILAPLHQNYIC